MSESRLNSWIVQAPLNFRFTTDDLQHQTLRSLVFHSLCPSVDAPERVHIFHTDQARANKLLQI